METHSTKATQTAISPTENSYNKSLIHICEIIFIGSFKERNAFKDNLLHVLANNFILTKKKKKYCITFAEFWYN